jgi:integrase
VALLSLSAKAFSRESPAPWPYVSFTISEIRRIQAPLFLPSLAQRKRKPCKPATLELWGSLVRTWIGPRIGSLPLESFGNRALKKFADSLCNEKLSPRTIREIAGLTKRIVASAIDENGDEKFPRKWKTEYLDLPQVRPASTASPNSDDIHGLFCRATGRYAVLYAALASTGLRVSEGLGLRIGALAKHKKANPLTTYVFESPVNQRPYDLASAGKHIKPALAEHGVFQGWHAFRRGLGTNLYDLGVPDPTIQGIVRHSNVAVTQSYIKKRETAGVKAMRRLEKAIRRG